MTEPNRALDQANAQYEAIVELLETGDCEAITENALEVAVRSEWTRLGTTLRAEEFFILLCTGGPAVRVVGELDEYQNPISARIEYQDWRTQWTTWHPADSAVLADYASYFFFG